MSATRTWSPAVLIGITAAAALVAAGSAVGVAQASADKPSATAKATTTGAAKDTDGLAYVPIKEPFSPPERCDPAGSTLEMTDCFLIDVVAVDQEIDVLQRQRFAYALTRADRLAYLQDDARWLKERRAEVRQIDSGGTIDVIGQAQKTLEISRQRLAALS